MSSRPARTLGNAALSLGAVLGVVCMLFLIATLAFGYRAVIFRSGSMSPAISTGSLGVAHEQPAGELKIGEVVMVPYRETYVSHRISSITHQADSATLILKGDANESADTEPYVVRSAHKIVFTVPWVGAIVAWLSRAPGIFVLAGYAAVLLALIMRRRPQQPGQPGPTDPADGRRRRGGGRKATRAAVATLSLVVVGTAPAWAVPWTDTVNVGGTTLTARVIAAPVVSCGTLSIGSTTLNWTPVAGATGYTLNYGTNGTVTETVGAGVTSKVFSGLATSGRFSVRADVNFGSVTWTSAPSNAKNYSVLLFLVGACTDA